MRALGVVWVDVDGVLADLVGAWLKRYNNVYNTNLRNEDITHYDISRFLVLDQAPLRFLVEPPDIYTEVDPIPYSLEAIRTLKKHADEVLYVTTPNADLDTMGEFEQKAYWLYKSGFEPSVSAAKERLCMVANRSYLRGDMLIDDRPRNIKHWLSFNPFGFAVLFDQPWNHNFSASNSFFRLQGWQHIEELVEWVIRHVG